MEKCLVKKYKAAVNNPNLPVLEVMSQITLDALTRGGNMTVSDAQKTVLNHFFYEIGAVSNNTLWGKVRTLMLPIIGNGKDYVIQDYRNSGSAISSTYVQDKIGALSLTEGSGNKTIDFNGGAPLKTISGKNHAVMVALTGESIFSSTTTEGGFRGKNSENKVLQRIFTIPSNSIAYSITDTTGGSQVIATKRFDVDVSPIILFANVNNEGISAKGILTNGNEIQNVSTDYGDFSSISTSFTESTYSVRLRDGYDYGILIDFSESLTNAEVTKVLNAVKDLRLAFLPST